MLRMGVVGLGLLVAVGGCGKQPSAASQPGESVLAAYRRMRESCRTGQYRRLEAMIDPNERIGVVDTLMAVDALLRADRRREHLLTERYGEAVAELFSLQWLGNQLGPFSREVQVVSHRDDGETAVVMVQVADRLPLEAVRFTRRQGQWVYLPGPPPTGFVEALDGITAAIEQSTTVLRRDPQMELTAFERYLADHVDPLIRQAATAAGPPTRQPATRPSR